MSFKTKFFTDLIKFPKNHLICLINIVLLFQPRILSSLLLSHKQGFNILLKATDQQLLLSPRLSWGPAEWASFVRLGPTKRVVVHL
jgi:hypothetical protein